MIKNYKKFISKIKRKHPTLNTLIVIVAIIFIWRSIWSLADIFIFPEDKVFSNVFTLVLGFTLLFFDDFKLDEL
jgi:uncharacterized membrane protein